MTKVRTGRRRTGGVAITLTSMRPASAACRVRGIGVAVSVSTCTPWRRRTQPLLLLRSEALLLVDDQEPEVGEAHALGDASACVPMTTRTEPSASPARTVARLGAVAEAGQLLHPDVEPGEAAAEGLEVLADQDRGRRDHRDLLAGERGGACRAQGHFGLAEADVAADQPVHRRRAALEVGKGRFERRGLVRRSA